MTSAPPRNRKGLVLIGFLTLLTVTVFTSLGFWQVQRLDWKTDLIARVDARLSAPVTKVPGPPEWDELSAQDDEYRRTVLTGSYVKDADALVKAVAEYGSGYWVLSPLRTPEGWIVWINRGFVPQGRSNAADRPLPEGLQKITGLLRMNQPGGAFLRSNDPENDRWYSRDVRALAQTRGLDNVAPYFIDAARSDQGGLPIGGLTVVSFRNAHLGYALTWFALAIGLTVASVILLRREWHR